MTHHEAEISSGGVRYEPSHQALKGQDQAGKAAAAHDCGDRARRIAYPRVVRPPAPSAPHQTGGSPERRPAEKVAPPATRPDTRIPCPRRCGHAARPAWLGSVRPLSRQADRVRKILHHGGNVRCSLRFHHAVSDARRRDLAVPDLAAVAGDEAHRQQGQERATGTCPDCRHDRRQDRRPRRIMPGDHGDSAGQEQPPSVPPRGRAGDG